MSHDPPYSGKILKADKVHDLSRAQSYNPELTASTTDPDLGEDGEISGWYHRGGHLIVGGVWLQFSGSGISGGSGVFELSLPVDADTSLLTTSNLLGSILGAGMVRDGSGATSGSRKLVVFLSSASTVRMAVADGTDLLVDESDPISWGDGDRLSIDFAYAADPDAL